MHKAEYNTHNITGKLSLNSLFFAYLKIFILCKVLVTDVTGEWFLSSMYTLMFTQFVCFTKILATKCTIEFA
jgi:hypothetical protein